MLWTSQGKTCLCILVGFFCFFFIIFFRIQICRQNKCMYSRKQFTGKKIKQQQQQTTFRESNVWGGLGRVAGMELKDNFCPWVKLGTLQIDRKYSDCHSCQLGNTRNRDHIAARLWGQIYTILASTESMTCTSTSCFTLTATEQRGRHSKSRDKSKLPVQTSMW